VQSGHHDAPSPYTTRRNADVHMGQELYEDVYGWSHVSWSHIQPVTFNLSWAHYRHLTTPALSAAALSTPAIWFRIVHSCNVHSWHIVLIWPLLQIPSLQHGAELSTTALSTPANSAFPLKKGGQLPSLPRRHWLTIHVKVKKPCGGYMGIAIVHWGDCGITIEQQQ